MQLFKHKESLLKVLKISLENRIGFVQVSSSKSSPTNHVNTRPQVFQCNEQCDERHVGKC